MIGNIYKILMLPPTAKDWDHYHLMPLEIRQVVPYGSCDRAAHCLVLETGERHDIYTDVLAREGKLVA